MKKKLKTKISIKSVGEPNKKIASELLGPIIYQMIVRKRLAEHNQNTKLQAKRI